MSELKGKPSSFFNDEWNIIRLSSSSLFDSEGSGNQKKAWVGKTLVKLNSKYHEDDKGVAALKIGKAFGLR